MTTFITALNRAVSDGCDRAFLHLPGRTPLTLGELADMGDRFAEIAVDAGLRCGDTVVLEASREAWPLFVSAYLGCHRHGFVPAVVGSGAPDRVRALMSCTPARLHVMVDGSATGWQDCVMRAVEPDIRSHVGVAEYLVTSGTTGQPAVVAVSDATRLGHRGSGRGRAVAMSAPPGTNASQTVLARALLSPSGAVGCVATWSPESFAEVVESSGASTLLLAPALALSLVRSPTFRRERFSTVRTVRLSMAPAAPAVFPEVACAFPDVEVVDVYTTTEAWPAGTIMRYGRDDRSTVGTPLPGSHVRVVSPGGDGTGLIQLAHDSTRAADGSLRWVATGDVGRIDSGGAVTLVSRASDLVTRGGSLVALTGVEDTVLGTGLVDDVAAAGIDQDGTGAVLGVVVVWRGEADETALRDAVRRRLGADAVPSVVRGVATVPRDGQGKIRRREVEIALRLLDVVPATSSDVDDVADRLAAIWCEVLLRESVGGDDHFFDLGGDSLTMVVCNALVEERIGVLIPLEKHREVPIFRSFTEIVRSAITSGAPEV